MADEKHKRKMREEYSRDREMNKVEEEKEAEKTMAKGREHEEY